MSDANPTERMYQLLASVRQALGDLDAGKLDLDGLDRASEDARALYERLIVLRHKAREGRSAPPAGSPGAAVNEPPPVVTPAELPSLRLDTRPPESPPRQTSLIDAIAESETKPRKKVAAAVAPPAVAPADVKPVTDGSAPPKAKPAKPVEKSAPKGPTLADKLEHAPVADLHKAIALSQKFWFVAELFGGQRERYEKAIDSINSLKSLEEARTFVASEVLGKTTKPPADDAVQAFTELVERRFK